MKKSWKKKSLPGTAAALFAAALVLALGGCEQPEGSGGNGSKGTISVSLDFDGDGEGGQQNVSGALRTVYPALTAFTRYTAEFEATSGGENYGPVEVTPEENTIEIELKVGTYTVTVTAYTGTDPDYTEAAIGETEGVAVSADNNDPVTVQMGPVTEGSVAQGTFSYAITFPAGVTSAQLVITPEGGEANTPVDLLTLSPTPGTGTASLDPGYYDVAVSLTKDVRGTGDSEVLHIYPGLVSSWTKEFTDDNFTAAPGTIGGQDITIKFGAAEQIPIENYSDPITIQKGGESVTLSVASSAGYTEVKWIVDGNTSGATTADSITLDPDDYDVKIWNLTVRAVKDGAPYARPLQFTVTAAGSGGGGPVTVGPVSAAELAATLASAGVPVGTAETPTTVKLSSFDVTGNTWGTTVKPAVAEVEKYITLDLSDCTATSNEIKGSASPTGNNFNIIKTDYIVGIILPTSLVKINGSAFNKWTSIRYVTIPNGVTEIGINVFYGTINLKSITIPNSVTTIKGAAFQDGGLESITIPSSVTSIAAGTFQGASSLTSVTFETGSLTLPAQTFDGDLHTVYNNAPLKTGTYKRGSESGSSAVWTKQ